MIEVNLASKRKKSSKAPVVLGVDFAKVNYIFIAIATVIYLVIPGLVKNAFVGSQAKSEKTLQELNVQLRSKIKETRKFGELNQKLELYEKQYKELEKRSERIEQITQTRSNPKFILETLARKIPQKLWFESLSIAEDRQIVLKGKSTDFPLIDQFVKEINSTAFFKNSLKLVKTETVKTDDSNPLGERLESFEISGEVAAYFP